MATNTATNTDDDHPAVLTRILCRILHVHNYAYDTVKYGDVFATEKTCMRCGKTEISKPVPTATRT